MNVKKANVSISTIDSTTRSNTFDDTWNAVVVVNTPTGPYEKTQIPSKTKFIEKYLTSDTISGDDDPTIQNTAFLLDSMPLTVIRASSVKVKAGVTIPSGLPIYTDSNYTPFTFSSTFSIPENVGATCYPELCIKVTDDEGITTKYSWLVTADKDKYSDTVLNYADDPTWLDTTYGFDENVQGMDLLLSQFDTLDNSNLIDGFKIDSSNSKYFIAYMTDGVEIQNLPEWVYESNTSDLSYDVSKTTFIVSQALEIGDYLSVNGYYFYYASSSTNNFTTSGTPVQVKVLDADREAAGGNSDMGVFSIYVKDLLRSSSTYKDPLITDETMGLTVEGSGTITPIGAIYDKFLKFEEDTFKVKTTTVLSSGTSTDGLGLEINIGGKTNDNWQSKATKFAASKDGDGNFVATDFGGPITAGQNYVEITTKAGTTITVDDSAVLDNPKKITDGGFEVEYNGTATVRFQYKAEGDAQPSITVSNPADGWTAVNAFVYYPYFDDSEGGTTYRFYCDFNTVPSYYPTDLTGSNVCTVATTSGKITIEKFLLKVAVFLRSKMDEGFITTADFAISSSTMYSLNSVYKELTTNDETKIDIQREVEGFKKVSISKDSLNLANLTYWFVLKIGTYTFYNNPDYTPTNSKEILVAVGSSKMSKQDFLTEVFSSISHNTTYYSIDDGESEFTLFSSSSPSYTSSIQVGTDEGGYEDPVELDPVVKSYDSETAERGAVIQKFASKVPLAKMTLVSNDDLPEDNDEKTYVLTLAYREDSNDYTVSFKPGATDGYGVNQYWDYINNSDEYFFCLDLNKTAKASAMDTVEFGDEIYPTEPTLTDYQSALDVLLKKDGNYYDYICTVGYDNASYIKYAGTIGSQIYTQVFSAVPSTVNSVTQAVSFRSGTGIDNWQCNMFYPYFYTTAVGEFTALISPACAALAKAYNNKQAYKEFVPLFWKEYGVVSVPTTHGSMNGLIDVVTETEDQESLLGAQINPIVIDEYLNISYLLDHWTMQTIDSDLSDSCNVRMINVISHVADQLLDSFIAKDNNKLWRNQVITQLTNGFDERFASQTRKYNNVRIVCDETNNPINVIRNRQLVVDIYIQFEVAVKYIKVYNRVIPLEEA